MYYFYLFTVTLTLETGSVIEIPSHSINDLRRLLSLPGGESTLLLTQSKPSNYKNNQQNGPTNCHVCKACRRAYSCREAFDKHPCGNLHGMVIVEIQEDLSKKLAHTQYNSSVQPQHPTKGSDKEGRTDEVDHQKHEGDFRNNKATNESNASNVMDCSSPNKQMTNEATDTKRVFREPEPIKLDMSLKKGADADSLKASLPQRLNIPQAGNILSNGMANNNTNVSQEIEDLQNKAVSLVRKGTQESPLSDEMENVVNQITMLAARAAKEQPMHLTSGAGKTIIAPGV